MRWDYPAFPPPKPAEGRVSRPRAAPVLLTRARPRGAAQAGQQPLGAPARAPCLVRELLLWQVLDRVWFFIFPWAMYHCFLSLVLWKARTSFKRRCCWAGWCRDTALPSWQKKKCQRSSWDGSREQLSPWLQAAAQVDAESTGRALPEGL